MSDRQQNVWWQGLFQVCAWHDRSYLVGIPLLANGLTVKVSPCPCSHSSLAGLFTCTYIVEVLSGKRKIQIF